MTKATTTTRRKQLTPIITYNPVFSPPGAEPSPFPSVGDFPLSPGFGLESGSFNTLFGLTA